MRLYAYPPIKANDIFLFANGVRAFIALRVLGNEVEVNSSVSNMNYKIALDHFYMQIELLPPLPVYFCFFLREAGIDILDLIDDELLGPYRGYNETV